MKRKIILAAVMALSLSLGNTAFADNRDHGRQDRGNQHEQMNRHQANDRNNNGNYRHDRYTSRRHEIDRNGPGAGRDHNFYRGGRLPSEYRQQYYVVNDWRGHRLNPPPRGYHWVQTGPDYVLVAITSGIIAQILLSH